MYDTRLNKQPQISAIDEPHVETAKKLKIATQHQLDYVSVTTKYGPVWLYKAKRTFQGW